MPYARVIPSLLVHDGGLVKTVRFKNPKYVGDPINAIRIFNDKAVDELMVLDIDASKYGRGPNISFLKKINREAFMPLAYGGGIRNVDDVKNVLSLGYEKVVINHSALADPEIITRMAEECGSQSLVVCIDVKKDIFRRYRVYDNAGRGCTARAPLDWAMEVEKRGAGEIIIYSVDNEGTYRGFDLKLLDLVTHKLKIPVVALGGAGCTEDFANAVKSGASAVAAGSLFVFQGPHRAVLISYPKRMEVEALGRLGAR